MAKVDFLCLVSFLEHWFATTPDYLLTKKYSCLFEVVPYKQWSICEASCSTKKQK